LIEWHRIDYWAAASTCLASDEVDFHSNSSSNGSANPPADRKSLISSLHAWESDGMKRVHLVRFARANVIALMFVAGVAAGPGAVRGQMLDNSVIGGFEIAPAGSLEAEMLSRLSVTGQYQARDLPRLARLTVLESIAMYENLRADLRETSIGARLEGEMSQLWDAAELFAIGANYPPPDLAGLNRSRAMLADVNAAYRQVDSSLGQLPGLSTRAAIHLQDIARLLPVMNAVFEAIDAEVARPVAAPVDRATDLAALQEQSRRLAEDLRGLGTELDKVIPAPAGRAGLIEDLNGLIDLVHGFDRMLSADPSNRDLVNSLRLVRSRMWTVEARIVRLAGTPALRSRWRQVRQRIDALSDQFELPRVISLVRTAGPARGVDRKLVARVDRAVAALDEFLSQAGAGLKRTEEGSEFEGQVGRLRLSLLQLRQRAIANESAGPLTQLIREIEAMNQQLVSRARPDDRITRGGSTLKVPGFQAPSQAVSKLGDSMSKP
jgi:hypothetical protein